MKHISSQVAAATFFCLSLFAFNSAKAQYCPARADHGDVENISNVYLNTINNSSSSKAGYEDFTTISTNLTAGSTGNYMSAVIDDTYSNGYRLSVFIDFNHDFDFNDPGEKIFNGNSNYNYNPNFNFNVPANAVNGSTRMRVRIDNVNFSGANNTPCGNSNFGEVEDYTINIVGGICAPPTLSAYANTSIVAGQNISITPGAVPTGATRMVAYTNTNFTGLLTVNPATGVVTVTDAKQAGIYPVTVKAFNGSACTAATTFTLTITNPACSQGLFSGTNDIAAGSFARSVAVGDFNGDGKQDIAVANSADNSVTIRLGDGVGGFSGTTNIAVGNLPANVAVGDFNGDGKQDIATANYNGNSVSIRLGDGAGGFSGATNLSVGSPVSVAVGDFNGDGKQDIATANSSDNSVSTRLGDGAGGFSGITNIAVGDYPVDVAVGDFNGDGKQDIATANYSSNTVSIRFGDGAGGFSGTTEVSVGSNPYNVGVGDFNGDGKQDIAAANSSDNSVSIRLGDGAGGFSGTTNIAVGNFPVEVAIGDFNGDGKQDIAAANESSHTVSIRLGDGAGGFSGNTDVSVGYYPYSVAVGDFNGDGKQDIAAANSSRNTVSIRLGYGAGSYVTTQPIYRGCDAINTDLNNGITNNPAAITFTFYSDNAYMNAISNIVDAPGRYYVKGDSSNCSAFDSIRVIGDTMPPTIICPNKVTDTIRIANTANPCSKAVTLTAPATSDSCSGVLTMAWTLSGATTGTGTGDIPSSQLFNVGKTDITYTVTDASGNSASCTKPSNVTIIDGIAPVITNTAALQSFTQGTDAGLCTANVNFTDVAVDESCTTLITWRMTGATVLSGSGQIVSKVLNIGQTRVYYTVYDGYNAVAHTYTVTVKDMTPPTLNVPANQPPVSVTAGCNASVSVPAPTYSDDCSSIYSLTWRMTGATSGNATSRGINPVGTRTFNVGVTTITYTLTDNGGNITTGNYIVTVVDNIAPTVSCSFTGDPAAQYTTTLCSKSIVFPAATYADNCSILSLTWSLSGATNLSSPATGINQLSTKTLNLGITHVLYTAKDLSGNTGTCGYDVTVTDVTPPVIRPVANIILFSTTVDCNKMYAVPNAVVTDNCGLASLSWTMTGATSGASSGSGVQYVSTQTFKTGITTITYTATDVHSNVSTGSFTVTVKDGVKPTVNCGSAIIASITAGCDGKIDIPVKTYSDACGTVASLTWAITGATTASSPSTGFNQVGYYLFHAGTNTITYSATDSAGNIGTCTQSVWLKEPVKPTAMCPSPYTSCQRPAGYSYAIPSMVPDDNCSTGSQLSVTYAITGATVRNGAGNDASGTFNAGTSQIKWTVKDGSGNVVQCSTTVTITGPCSSPRMMLQPLVEVKDKEAISALQASLSPNPTAQSFALKVQAPTTEAVEVHVYNQLGQQVQQMKGSPEQTYRFGETYQRGNYIIEVRQGDKRVTVKGVKQ